MNAQQIKRYLARCTDTLRQSNDEAEQREMMRLCAANEQRERKLRQPFGQTRGVNLRAGAPEAAESAIDQIEVRIA